MGITALAPEALVTITHFIFVWSAWFLGRLFYVPITSCKEGIFGCNFWEPFGLGTAFCASILYFYISRHVLNFLYKGQLPGGEDLSKVFKQMMPQNQKAKARK